MNILKKLLEQKYIDNGQLGKFIIVLGASTFPFTPLAFLSAFGSIYKLELYRFFNIYIWGSVFLFIWALWLLFMWKYGFPSMQKGGNQQGWEHGNPIRSEFENLNADMKELKEMIKEMKK